MFTIRLNAKDLQSVSELAGTLKLHPMKKQHFCIVWVDWKKFPSKRISKLMANNTGDKKFEHCSVKKNKFI
jgi:hypothetical protein